MKKFILPLLVLAACASPERSRPALRKAGFTDIKITGYRMFACSEDDAFSTGFRARNPQGEMVEGVVCCGLIAKNCTVRF